ncbi:MAG: UbiA family prenyltransferase [Candidatus Helarchaeota archaeon]
MLMSPLKNYGKLLRAPSKIMPIMNFTLMFIFGFFLEFSIFDVSISFNSLLRFFGFLLALGSFLCAWIFAVGINDYHDVETDSVINPDRPLVSGSLTHSQVKKFTIFFLISSFILAICGYLIIFNIIGIILVGVYLVLAFVYSAPPIKLKYRTPFATLVIGLACFLTIMGGSLFSAFTPKAIITAILFGIISFVLSLAKDFKDLEGDKAANIPTLPVIYGEKKAGTILLVSGPIVYFCLFFFIIYNVFFLVLVPVTIFIAVGSWLIVFYKYIQKPSKEKGALIYKIGFGFFLLVFLVMLIIELFV